MFNLHLNFVSKLLLVAAFCFIAIFVLPVFNLKNTDSILTPATFLFSVLYGFEISVAISNFIVLKTQLAIENAGLLTIYHLAAIIGGDTFKKIDESLENYLLAAIDYPLAEHLKIDKQFFNIFEPIKELDEVEGAQRGQALQYLNEAIYYVPQARNQVADVAPRFVDISIWAMLIFLGLVLVGVLFASHGPDVFSKITAAVFSTTVISALILLDEIDSNQIREAYVEYEMFNDTLESIGKSRYYPEFAVQKDLVKVPKKKYRVGVFPKYPSLADRRIEIRG